MASTRCGGQVCEHPAVAPIGRAVEGRARTGKRPPRVRIDEVQLLAEERQLVEPPEATAITGRVHAAEAGAVGAAAITGSTPRPAPGCIRASQARRAARLRVQPTTRCRARR